MSIVVHYQNHKTKAMLKISVEKFMFDTETTVRNRIAWALDTLPEYLWMNSSALDQKEERLYVVDALHVCQNDIDIVRVLTELEDKFSADQIIPLWAVYHYREYSFAIIDPNFYSKYKSIIDSIGEFQIDSVLQTIIQKNDAFRTLQQEVLKKLSFLEKIPEDPSVSEIHTDKTIFQIRFTCAYDSLEGVFDSLQTMKAIPFIFYNQYYKIHKEYIPPVNWSCIEDRIIAKYYHTESTAMNDADKYVDITIYKSVESNMFYIEMEKMEQYSDPVESLLRDFIQNISQLSIVDTNQSTVGGYFTTEILVDNYILADIFFTTTYVSDYITFNDNIRIVGRYGNRHIYFATSEKEAVIASITRRLATSDDPEYLLNTPFTRIKIIRGTNNDAIYKFKHFFSKLLHIYTINETELIKTYEKYGMEVKETEDTFKTTRRKPREQLPDAQKKIAFLKDLNQTVFTSRHVNKIYSRTCQKERQPKLIPSFGVDEYKQEQVLLFPKQDDAHIAPPQYYACDSNDYPFPGLVAFENDLGVAPCCFKKDQKNARLFKDYYFGDQGKKKETAYLKQSDKIAKKGEYAYFPTSTKIINHIGSFFQKLNISVIRRGVEYSPNSFLTCILEALNHSEFLSLPDHLKPQFLFEQRKQLYEFLALGRQEMYGESVNDIQNFLNGGQFLDPERVIRLVEAKYKCNILLFSKSEKYPMGELIVPRHLNGYYKYQQDHTLPSIFIYVHMGAERDVLQYPHCELICPLSENTKIQKTSQLDAIWSPNQKGYDLCWKIYDTLSTYYHQSRKIPEFPKQIAQRYQITRQWVDEFGKVRRIEINSKIIETSPLPPMNIPFLPDSSVSLLTINEIETFIQQYALQKITEYKIQGHVQYKEGWVDSYFSMRFYVQSPDQALVSLSTSPSIYRDFIGKHKLARCLTNWCIYLYSEFVASDSQNKTIQEFMRRFLIVRPNHQYKVDQLKSIFDKRISPTLFEGRQLICTSETLRNQLIYQLRLLLTRDKQKVIQFKNKKSLESYYLSEHDFTKYPHESIVYFDESSPVRLVKMLDNAHPIHKIYSTIPSGITEPFFFKNPHITQNRIALGQITSTLESAVNCGLYWKDYHRNTCPVSYPISSNEPFYLYTLSSDREVKKYQVNTSSNKIPDTSVIASISSTSQPVFTSLMFL